MLLSYFQQGLLIPALYFYGLRFNYLTKYSTCMILGAITAFLLVVEVLRLNSDTFKKAFMFVAGSIIRKKESDQMSGSTNFVLGSFLTILLFHPIIAITSLLYLILGDLSAALVRYF